MKIVIDGRCLSEGRRTGVEEFTYALLGKILEKDRENEYVIFMNSFGKSRADFVFLKKYDNVEIKCYHFPNKVLNFLFWFAGWPKIDRMVGGADVYLSPNISFLAASDECRKIVVAHDLSFELFPETFSFKRKIWHFLVNPRKIFMSFDEVWSVSESTKADLKMIYGINPDKIRVISSPLDFLRYLNFSKKGSAVEATKNKYSLPENFFLFFGTIEPRKNILALIEAFELFVSKNHFPSENFYLVIAGAAGWSNKEIVERIKGSKFSSRMVLLEFIPDEDKASLYALSKIFVYPSFFEGFGIPPLEAMSFGVPVICSNTSSMPEVTGDAAILVDPYRPYEIYLAIKNLLESPELYTAYENKGIERVTELQKKWSNNPNYLFS